MSGQHDRCGRVGIGCLLAALLLAAAVVRAQPAMQPATQPGKTVRLLAIGNSFSQNATAYLRPMAAAGGHTLVLGHAAIGGCPLDKHVDLARKHEANPDDPAGKPYKIQVGGTTQPVSLKHQLRADQWDYVTVQQRSGYSYDLTTYRPHAQQLADYVRRYAPQARLLVHETWAYRADDPLFKDGMTQERMYRQLHAAYATISREVGAAGVIPVGTAFHRAGEDPRWKMAFESPADPNAYQPPRLPRQVRSLNIGYAWNTKGAAPKLTYDGHHASIAGKFLGGAVWYETLFGDVRSNPYVPPGLPPEDAAILRAIAHATVAAR